MSTNPALARLALRELVKLVLDQQHRKGGELQPIRYGELSQRIRRTRRQLGVGMGAVLGVLGHELEELGTRTGEAIPLIQTLVVLKRGKSAGLPDKGMDEFWKGYSLLAENQKRERVRHEYKKIARFGPRWEWVVKAIDSQSTDMGSTIGRAEGGHRQGHAWVMKGNPRWYDWDANLRPGREEDWHASSVPNEMAAGDRIFFWESGGKLKIIALGEVIRRASQNDSDGKSVFYVRYLTPRLKRMPDIELLKSVGEICEASFLQPGIFRTVYPLTDLQANALYRVVVSENPEIDIWEAPSGTVSVEDVEMAVREGGPRLLAHIALERRNRAIVERKKRDFRSKHGGRLFCECCGFDFVAVYGPTSDGVCEVHHRRQLAASNADVLTSLRDLAVLCPNCHRIIHRFDPMISVEELAAKVAERRSAPRV
jgi:hypothetical protein